MVRAGSATFGALAAMAASTRLQGQPHKLVRVVSTPYCVVLNSVSPAHTFASSPSMFSSIS